MSLQRGLVLRESRVLRAACLHPSLGAVAPLARLANHGRPFLTSEIRLSAVTEKSFGLAAYKTHFQFPRASAAEEFEVGKTVAVHGFLSARRSLNSRLTFADIQVSIGPHVQVETSWQDEGSARYEVHQALKQAPLHSSVAVTGRVLKVNAAPSSAPEDGRDTLGLERVDLALESIQVLNPFPKDIIVSDGVQFPPAARHLQLRFSEPLRRRLAFRAHLGRLLRESLEARGLTEIETPVLFKSTPEGAREFVVPTRRRGYAYALPQSPQQYKQLLMASGVGGYFQLARCFRDEDLRVDRQPEFTQLDLEKSFATGEDVMRLVEATVRETYEALRKEYRIVQRKGVAFPVRRSSEEIGLVPESQAFPPIDAHFPRVSYHEAMTLYGSDKPDLRIPGKIRRVETIVPKNFTSMITDLSDPIVEAYRFRPGTAPPETWAFVKSFMDALPKQLAKNPDGAPAVMIFDSSKPLSGLSSLGHEGCAGITSITPELEDISDFEDGDILFIQARKNEPFQGGSTALGDLRRLIYHTAVERELLPKDPSLKFLWITGFPLFTANNEVDPGQGGTAGFHSTHHPFTAPLSPEDFDRLTSDPLKAKADHYDLVLNGVELGGGSRRVHIAAIQEYIMREILKMTDDGVARFSHLLGALRAGCPPHAGFALGFDRFAAVLSGTDSIRDVIAFPKTMKGEDLMVKSPGKLTGEQLRTYHLSLAGGKAAEQQV